MAFAQGILLTVESRPPLARSDARLPVLSLLRYIAVIAVIWTHAAAHTRSVGHFSAGSAARFGSAFFTQCSIFLTLLKAYRPNRPPFWVYARSRFERIYLPFLGWTLIYALLGYFQVAIQGHGKTVEWRWSLFWNGGDYHLWFLPFILVVSIVVYGVGELAGERWRWPMIGGCILAGVAIAHRPFVLPQESFGDDYALMLAWNRLPSVLWGMAAALLWQTPARSLLQTRAAAAVGLGLLIGCMSALGRDGSNCLIQNLAGTATLLLALSAANGLSLPFAADLGRLTYGVYLCHLIFVGMFRAGASRLGGDQTLLFAIVTTILTTLLASALSYGLTRTRKLRWLAPA